MARYRLLVVILETYDRLSLFQGFLFEQEPFFAYKSSVFIADAEDGFWVVAYSERNVFGLQIILAFNFAGVVTCSHVRLHFFVADYVVFIDTNGRHKNDLLLLLLSTCVPMNFVT